MNKIKMKARAGVTLVELLVVILIITILSVSLLPLLKPYIEESKYAAEPIPVLANIQTKINLYQYEKDNLPGVYVDDTRCYTWMTNGAPVNGVQTYIPAYFTEAATGGKSETKDTTGNHIQDVIDVDWQDLLGRRMNPTHFQYHIIKGDGASQYGYAIGVFGDGNGLGKGTGYAVLNIVDTVHTNKIVATWSKYKPSVDAQLTFSSAATPSKEAPAVYVPMKTTAFSANPNALITSLKAAGWEFNGDGR